MRIRTELHEAMIAHARAEAPNESCGMLGGRHGEPLTFYPARNSFESPMRFEVDSRDQIRIMNEIDEAEEELVVLFHSHPATEAYPSQTDVNLAGWWPGVVWAICSLAGDEPVIRAFSIDDGAVAEIELEIG